MTKLTEATGRRPLVSYRSLEPVSRWANSGRAAGALHSYFTRRGNQQQLDQKKYIRPETLARLSPAARFILDV